MTRNFVGKVLVACFSARKKKEKKRKQMCLEHLVRKHGGFVWFGFKYPG